jgi:hypothetical protein
VTDQARIHVTTYSVTFQLSPQIVPDSELASEMRGLNFGELRDRYTLSLFIITPDHPEVPPRNWANQVPLLFRVVYYSYKKKNIVVYYKSKARAKESI